MELRHIRYFIAVAEERNFTRAAARVGIGQPPLSQQIRDLEQEVGAQLFHRVPHGAELTEAGHAFLAAVRAIPGQATDAIRSAQRAARGETGVLRIGFTGSATLNPVVPGTIRRFRRDYPDVQLALSEANSTGLAAALRDGSLDTAFLRPESINADDMHLSPLPDEPMLAALPAAHRLAADDEIMLASLRDELFVLTPRGMGPALFDAATNACLAAGFTPRLGQPAPQIVSVLSLVAAEEGVSIVPACMRQLALAEVAYRPMRDVQPVARLSLARLKSNRSRITQNFILTARANEAI